MTNITRVKHDGKHEISFGCLYRDGKSERNPTGIFLSDRRDHRTARSTELNSAFRLWAYGKYAYVLSPVV